MTPDELRAWRHRHGLTQDDLATALGYRTYNTVRRWEAGETPIPGWLELALAELERRLDVALPPAGAE